MLAYRSLLLSVWYAFLVWLIPFVASFVFYSPDGKLREDVSLLTFKKVMMVVSQIASSALLVRFFRYKPSSNRSAPSGREGAAHGVVWAGVNWLLDIVVLVPMMGVSVQQYWNEIGLGYLVIPIQMATLGHLIGVWARREKAA